MQQRGIELVRYCLNFGPGVGLAIGAALGALAGSLVLGMVIGVGVGLTMALRFVPAGENKPARSHLYIFALVLSVLFGLGLAIL